MVSFGFLNLHSIKKTALIFCKIMEKIAFFNFVCNFVKNTGFYSKFWCRSLFLRRTNRKCLKKRKKNSRKSTVFRPLKIGISLKKTHIVKIPITWVLRWCHLFSTLMSGFPRSGIYTYLSKGRNENLFPKRFSFYL